MSYVRREDIVGKKAISPDGNTFGQVKDIAFSVDGNVGLVITTPSGSETILPIKQASAIGEYVLLSSVAPQEGLGAQRPRPAPPPSPPTACPSCGNPLKPGAKFCGKCGYRL